MLSLNTVKMRNQLYSIFPGAFQKDLSLEGPSVLDNDVKRAVKTCSESGTVSDILKLELKTKIQLRRLKKGKDMHFEEKPTQIEYELTPEDLTKRKELKERNKLSARKHRIKKKQEKIKMQIEESDLLEKNHILQRKLKKLESVRNYVCIYLSKSEAV